MKLSALACAASLASMAAAKTVFVTRLHYITVDANGDIVGSSVTYEGAATSSTAATEANENVVIVTLNAADSLTYLPTTLQTVAASYSTVSQEVAETSQTSTPTTESTTAANTESSSTDSGIYAEISSSGVDADFAKTILDLHNEKRALHSVGDLSWDTTVYKYAQAYADQYTCGSSLKHSGGQYGENLAVGFTDASSAFNAWYSEGENYDYSTANSFDHFTQIIWKGTTKLGCAYKDCGSGKYYICSYDPAGNIIGYGTENLFAS